MRKQTLRKIDAELLKMTLTENILYSHLSEFDLIVICKGSTLEALMHLVFLTMYWLSMYTLSVCTSKKCKYKIHKKKCNS